ncbi:hypothetical protein HDV01_006361 [Terramyces sp. JEL0728]|nr:hypothetical protein HDV01_006361 [Terramyces sp. JEL0728]
MPFPTLLPYQKQPRISSSKSFESINLGVTSTENHKTSLDFNVPDNIVSDQYRKFTEVREDQQDLIDHFKLKINEMEIKNKQLSLILHDYDQTIQSQTKEIKVLKAALANQEYGSPAHVKVLVSTIDGLQRELHRLRDQNSVLLEEDGKLRHSVIRQREPSVERKSPDQFHFHYKSPRASPTKLHIPNSNFNEGAKSPSRSQTSKRSVYSPTHSPVFNSSSNFSSSFNSPVLLQGKRELKDKVVRQEDFYPVSHLFNQKLPSPAEKGSKYPSPKSDRLGVFANLGKNINSVESPTRQTSARNYGFQTSGKEAQVDRATPDRPGYFGTQERTTMHSSTYQNNRSGYSDLIQRRSSRQAFSDNGDRNSLNTLHEQLNYIGQLLDRDEKDIAQTRPRSGSPTVQENTRATSAAKTRIIQPSHSVPDLIHRKGNTSTNSFEHRTSILKQPSSAKSPKLTSVRINPSPITEKWATSTSSSPSPTKSMLVQERDLLEQELLEQYERMRKMGGVN